MKNKILQLFFPALISGVMLCAVSCDDDPMVLGYEGFECVLEEQTLVIETGSAAIISGRVTVEAGLDKLEIKTGAWRNGEQGSSETVEIYGSPKIYDLSYEVVVPINAENDNTVEFVFTDYNGKTVTAGLDISIEKDVTLPTITVKRPVEPDNMFSPEERVAFNIHVTDDKKIDYAVLSCEAVGFSSTYLPASLTDDYITITEEVDITVQGDYTFVVTAYDAQGNRASEIIPVLIREGSRPAIVNTLGRAMTGATGGTLPFSFRISTDIDNIIETVVVSITTADAATSKIFTPNRQIVVLEDYLEIGAGADLHDGDLEIRVTATNNISETNQWTGTGSLIKGMFVTGSATVGKTNTGYSMPMEQIAGTNTFTYKTYAESSGDGLHFWSGTLSHDTEQWKYTANPVWTWGRSTDGVLAVGSTAAAAMTSEGYYIMTMDPVAATYSITPDQNVPATGRPVYAQISNAQLYNGSSWVPGADWSWVEYTRFPNSIHRYYLDVKTNNSNSGSWEKVVLGLAGQADSNGLIWGLVCDDPDSNYVYTYNGWASALEEHTEWKQAGKLSEKGDLPIGTAFRMVVDTYLMQVGWAPLSEYKNPATPPQ